MMKIVLKVMSLFLYWSCSYIAIVGCLSSYEDRSVREKVNAIESGQPLKYDFVDDYHFPMVADEVRNELYFEALKKVIIPNKSKVLDVGAGTMLLSMMAMDLGAEKVVGVEANPLMCNIARDILRLNGFTNDTTTGNVRLYEGKFESLNRRSKFVGKPADVVVSETFDAALIGEGFLSMLSHAKSQNLIKKSAKVVPSAATVFVQLLESTFSLPPGDASSNKKIFSHSDSPYLATRKYNLEPLRHHRPGGVFTVRYLDEQNALRKRLSHELPLFDFDFQNHDEAIGNFGYTCLLIEINNEEGGIVDSIGIWFNLYMDQEKSMVLSNAPNLSRFGPTMKHCSSDDLDSRNSFPHESTRHRASCWMQALYRVPNDIYVNHGDILRLQVVHLSNRFVFGDLSNVHQNSDSRLIKFIAINCINDVYVYAYKNDNFEEKDSVYLTPEHIKNEYLLGKIDSADHYVKRSTTKLGKASEPFKVFRARVHQMFKFKLSLEAGNQMGLLYQLPDSTEDIEDTVKKFQKRIPLDEYRIVCPIE